MSTAAAQVDALLRTVTHVALTRRRAFDRLDAAAGDGDFGSTLARGATALAAGPPDGDAAERLRAAARTVTAAMGGSSGPLLGAALLDAGRALDGAPAGPLDRAVVARSLRAAIDAVRAQGGAERGDKTVLDALLPLAEALEAGAGDLAAVTRAAAARTAEMRARRGRAAYAAERSRGAPDPGATAVAEVVEALAEDAPSWAALRAVPLDAADPADDAAPPERGFVGDPARFVDEALDGFARANAGLVKRLPGQQVIVRRERGNGVALVSGGGAGHEPLHAGYVGAGMLAAACPGAVFTSPAPEQILAATAAVDAGAGVLYVVKRYTGDVLNFRLAAELAAAAGIATETVIVDDDAAIDPGAETGRRGTGVTIAVEKIAGAHAAEGATLADVAATARRVVASGRSFGVALHGAQQELGVGIHGEPGRPREALRPVDAIARALLDPLLAELAPAPERPLLVLLSGLGGTPSLELHVLFEHVWRQLDARGLGPARALVGDLITSLDQAGAVLSLVALDDELLRLWDAPAHTPALRTG